MDENVKQKIIEELFAEFSKKIKQIDVIDKQPENITQKRSVGRPKGSRKRREETTVITATLTLTDKKFLQNKAKEKNMSMSDYVAYLIDKEREKCERLMAK